jgi:hypothetical protein
MWHERIHGAYVITAILAVAVAFYVFFWISLAKSWAEIAPMEDARPGRLRKDVGPNNGLTHVAARSSTGKAYFVVRNDETWKRARGADACETAALIQEMAVNRYSQVTPRQKETIYDALDVLPSTLTVRWAEAFRPEDAGKVQVEPEATYAMVTHHNARKDCITAMKALLYSELQRQQFARLMYDVI